MSDQEDGGRPRLTDLTALPAGLPEPVDDGACDHLRGMRLPPIELRSVDGDRLVFGEVSTKWLVVYVYPRTGGSGIDLPSDWDLIPGARGCTPQGCAFRDHQAELGGLDATVWGVSSQPLAEQQAFAAAHRIPFPLLNDAELRLGAEPLRLPTFEAGGLRLYRRVTLLVKAGRIEQVRYPVFPPDRDAAEVIAALRRMG